MSVHCEAPIPGFVPTAAQRQAVHDLRNLFGVVVAAKHGLERRPARVDQIALLEAIEDAAMRGSRLTTGLLGSASRDPNPRAFDVGVRLANLAPLMTTLAGTRVELDLEVACPNTMVRADALALDATVLELVANACAANARHIMVRSAAAGSRLWLLVADDGHGMTPQVLTQARGGVDAGGVHGAGLARVHDFVRNAHGRLRLRSREGRGTAIAIILPTVLGIAVRDRSIPRRQSAVEIIRVAPAQVRQTIAA